MLPKSRMNTVNESLQIIMPQCTKLTAHPPCRSADPHIQIHLPLSPIHLQRPWIHFLLHHQLSYFASKLVDQIDF